MSGQIRKGVTYAADNTVLDCLFCRIIAGKEPCTVVQSQSHAQSQAQSQSQAQTSSHPSLMGFLTINPATDLHILVTPRRHIQNIDALTKQDVPLLEEMRQFGSSLLTSDQQKDALYVFHLPPWNSIDHLHLHVIAHKSSMGFFNGYFKYLPGTPWCATIDTVIDRLNKQP